MKWRMCSVCGGNPEDLSLPGAKRAEKRLDQQQGTRIWFKMVPQGSLLMNQNWHTTWPSTSPSLRPRFGALCLCPDGLHQTRALGLRLGHLLQNLPKADYCLALGVSLALNVHHRICGDIFLETFPLGLTPWGLLLFVSMPFRHHLLLLYLTSSQNLLHPSWWVCFQVPLWLSTHAWPCSEM